MENSEFRKNAHQLVDWMADYLENIRDYPVKSQVEPGEIKAQIPPLPPEKADSFKALFEDFQNIIMPGITHWQHPSFFAYFTANSSPPSLLAEMLTATLGTQCMSWETSPAAAELEERVMEWLNTMLGLPPGFTGVIQDTASTATICAILTARERISDFKINEKGLGEFGRFSIYCSTETHSSVEKAVKIVGIGRDNLRKISTDSKFAMNPLLLKKAIEIDIENGITPLCVVGTLGTTSSTAIDPIREIGQICSEHSIWFHIDGAQSGTALILPEKRWIGDGLEYADSFVFNPHKWMFTNFDCSAYFVKDESALVRTFEINPEYLKTSVDDRVKNYRDWGIPLGRRFRALKLWFVIRTYGISGLREMVREHCRLAEELSKKIDSLAEFELLAPVPVNLICFRFRPEGYSNEDEIDAINMELLRRLNESGKLYLTHTKLNDKYTLRMSIGQTQMIEADLTNAWNLIEKTALKIKKELSSS